jgi:5'-nucleotidase
VTRSARILAVMLAAALGVTTLGSCSDDGDGDAGTTTVAESSSTGTGEAGDPASDTTAADATATCTTEQTGPLRIVLVNDDGVANPAIDVLIERFDDHDAFDLEVTVVAPAEERSGSSDATTPGGAAHTETTTPGGNEAYAVDGFPADAVVVALDDLGLEPHLVVSGINPGHNFGPFAALSGTVGVGRTAVRRGIPALAVSAGPELDDAQFDVGADLALAWIAEHCEAIVAGTFQTDTVTSINIPACPPDQMGPLQEVPRALELPEIAPDDSIFASTCDLADPAPADDVAAVRSGYPSLTQVEPEL